MTAAQHRELSVILAACEVVQAGRVPWWQIARVVDRLGSAHALLDGPWDPSDRWENDVAVALNHGLTLDAVMNWQEKVALWRRDDPTLRFVTILDREYPVALRSVFNPPPFLVMRGHLLEVDAKGVAVIGSRHPSNEGAARAHKLGRDLAEAGVTVYSGLAKGIDTAAHSGALDAGGRTIAVVGHGLLRPYYPKENRSLAERIVAEGAVVSQFRPDTPPTPATFPMRNVVMSGLAQGSVVVEATRTSGARMQARIAAEQGRRVWFVRSLVDKFKWAREFEAKYQGHVRVIDDASEVIEGLSNPEDARAAADRGIPPVSPAEAARRGGRKSDTPLVLFR